MTVFAPSTLVIVQESVPRVRGDAAYGGTAIHSFHLSLSLSRPPQLKEKIPVLVHYILLLYLSLSANHKKEQFRSATTQKRLPLCSAPKHELVKWGRRSAGS